MELDNDSRARCLDVVVKDKTGRDLCVVVAKYTFVVGERGTVEIDDTNGAEPYLIDVCHGDPASSSIKKPSDLFDSKPGTDVILVGHAHPPLRERASHVDVTLRVGPVRKVVRANGLRVWQAGSFGGLVSGPSRPIAEPVPLVYELAYGGLDLSDPDKPHGEPRNCVGRGVARDWRKLVGQPAAQLEPPDQPIGPGKNVPACFGAIHRHWQPRASYAGTYDEAWMATKMPLLPDDFDPRFNVAVPHDQWSPTPLRGDEPIEVLGATPSGALRFQLPRVALGFASWLGGVRTEHRSHLDTLLIDADERRVELTFRAAVPLPRKYEMLQRIEVIEKQILGPSGP